MEPRSATPTIEEVNAHFEKADLSQLTVPGPQVATAAIDPATALQSACKAYNVIKPFLQLVISVPFLPPSWKKAIQGFMNVMNILCPVL
jgi:hypothetical protein